MTREDVLEALELLPAWQLRVPVRSQNLEPKDVESVNVTSIVTSTMTETQATDVTVKEDTFSHLNNTSGIDEPNKAVDIPEVREIEAAASDVTVVTDSVYEKPLSMQDDAAPVALDVATQYMVDYYEAGHYLFIMAATPRSEAMITLLRNMLRAMRLNLPASQAMHLNSLATHPGKVVVAMGVMVSQALIGNNETFANLRTKVHEIADKKVIATFDAQYLIDQPQDKAQAWADLCLAMQTLKAMHT